LNKTSDHFKIKIFNYQNTVTLWEKKKSFITISSEAVCFFWPSYNHASYIDYFWGLACWQHDEVPICTCFGRSLIVFFSHNEVTSVFSSHFPTANWRRSCIFTNPTWFNRTESNLQCAQESFPTSSTRRNGCWVPWS
jgi:hypothetical protein